MPKLSRPRSPFPYDLLPALPTFTLSSTDLRESERVADCFTALHENISPALSWSGFPEETRSFVVSCIDPDAPTPSGWWHWTIVDLDASITSLAQGAGESDLMLEGAAFHVRNDSGAHGWSGPYPPTDDGDHRYVFAVHALDVETLGLDDEANPGTVAFHVSMHALARALLTVTYSVSSSQGAEVTALEPLR
ncbi:putative kinase inhibitor protein [Actinomyces bovis]|uniref:Kinase inhibitor protein n=1 Tax=Actinomyces bovis TaxID=1658 RepID=A0ABY1VL83_9ACTO|nr:YbhB/YbcL family Raf kinase inhibitor-like protein [Actinomyces bovis]SPT52427.1 putative kinase inhibitor protein [Actinomyces bovis]VEG54064.1 putative kinase inhibitor protein [Actinomyces israelii]